MTKITCGECNAVNIEGKINHYPHCSRWDGKKGREVSVSSAHAEPQKEPYLVDDPFDDEDTSWQTTSGIENLDIIKEAQKICRRPKHPFQKMSEKNKWLKIDRQFTKGMIGRPWIENCFNWAREKNKEYRVVIIMPALASLILNKARMTDFNAKLTADLGLPSKETRDLADDGY